jgi:epoxyqueuosine reductase QueG
MIEYAAQEIGAELVGFTKENEENIIVLGFGGNGHRDLGGVNKKTEELVGMIQKEGFAARIIDGTKAGGFNLSSLAERAGLGFIGRNGLLISSIYGPDVRFTGIVTNLDVSSNKEFATFGGCGDCEACLISCPSGAISQGKMEICRHYVKSRGPGKCTVCIDVCPYMR